MEERESNIFPDELRGGARRMVISVRRGCGQYLAVTDRPSVTSSCQAGWWVEVRRLKNCKGLIIRD